MSTTKQWFLDGDAELIVSLSQIESLNPIDWQKLRNNFTDIRAVLRASSASLCAAGLTERQAQALTQRSTVSPAVLAALKRFDIQLTTIDASDYPNQLRTIDDPPLWLFYRGSLSVCDEVLLSIVGTRKPSPYAQAAVELLTPPELLRQLVTVSGLAYGVDALIHQRSLSAGGKTVAVLAGGLDRIYPSSHTALSDAIVCSGGVLLSEYPPLARPKPYRFPIRNRIVAGLSRATLIIEARIQSGTLTTARSAVDYNRDLFVLPGRITDEASLGGNMLIASGATLLYTADQLAQYFNIQLANETVPNLDTPEGQLLHLLTDASYDLDELMAKTGMTIENILGLVTRLELSGSIFQDSAGRYSTKKHG